MPVISVKVLGTDEMERTLLGMARACEAAADEAAMAGAQMIRGFAVKNIRTRGEQTGTKTTASGRTIGTFAELGAPIPGRLTSRTGMLRASIRAEREAPGAWAVGPTAEYGRIHEFGGTTRPHVIRARRAKARPHVIRARRAKALAFVMGNQLMLRQSVHHPGSHIPPRPYLRPAFYEHVDAVRNAMIRALIKRLGAGA